MNKPSNSYNGAAQTPKADPIQNSPVFSDFKPAVEPTPAVVPAPATVPLQAAKGDDEIMSRPQQEQQQQMSLPSVDEIKGKWKQHVGAAKIAWGKLTEDEFLQLEGQEQKLTGLVQERYAITRDEADKQVKAFFDKNKS